MAGLAEHEWNMIACLLAVYQRISWPFRAFVRSFISDAYKDLQSSEELFAFLCCFLMGYFPLCLPAMIELSHAELQTTELYSPHSNWCSPMTWMMLMMLMTTTMIMMMMMIIVIVMIPFVLHQFGRITGLLSQLTLKKSHPDCSGTVWGRAPAKRLHCCGEL